jgi:hypothetical protein
MSCLILPRHHYSQTSGAVEIDWSNPITQNLTFASTGNSSPEVASVVLGATPYGLAVVGEGKVSATGARYIPSGSTTHSIMVFGVWPSTGYRPATAQNQFPSASPYAGTSLYPNNNGSVAFEDNDSTLKARAITATSVADGKPHVICGVRDGAAANTKIYVDGVNRAITITGNSGTVTNTGNQRVDVAGSDTGPNFLAAYWSRSLSEAEAIELTANPWQIFKAK